MKPAVFLAFVLVSASAAGAQKQPTPQAPCFKTIPASELRRVPVYLEATADSTARVILPNADFLAQSVALRIRELVSSDQSKLPEADSAVLWSALWGEVILVVRKDAPLSFQVPEWSREADTIPRSAVSLLRRAVADVIANGESVVLPESVKGDSISFGLSLVHPMVNPAGKIIPIKGRQPIPVFTIRVAWEKPVELTKEPHIRYPEISRSDLMIGNVQLAYAVDETGHIDMSTLKEIWPSGYKRPTGQLLRGYEAFVDAVKDGLRTARFSPASIGGCVVKQRVVQTFEFKMP